MAAAAGDDDGRGEEYDDTDDGLDRRRLSENFAVLSSRNH